MKQSAKREPDNGLEDSLILSNEREHIRALGRRAILKNQRALEILAVHDRDEAGAARSESLPA